MTEGIRCIVLETLCKHSRVFQLAKARSSESFENVSKCKIEGVWVNFLGRWGNISKWRSELDLRHYIIILVMDRCSFTRSVPEISAFNVIDDLGSPL